MTYFEELTVTTIKIDGVPYIKIMVFGGESVWFMKFLMQETQRPRLEPMSNLFKITNQP